MPQPKTEKPTAAELAEEKVASPEPGADVQTFTLERLRSADGEALTGFPSYAVAGAFAGVSDSTQITLADAKQRIRDWHKAKVTIDQPEEA